MENKEFVQEEAEGIGLEGKEKDKGEEGGMRGKKEKKTGRGGIRKGTLCWGE